LQSSTSCKKGEKTGNEGNLRLMKYTGWKVFGLYGRAQVVENSEEISGIFPITDVYYFAIERFQEFCQLLFRAFDHVGDFHLI